SGITFMVDSTGRRLEVFEVRGLGEEQLTMVRDQLEGGLSTMPPSFCLAHEEGEAGGIPHEGFPGSLARCGIRMWVPFTVEPGLEGGIGLGAKLSGDPFTEDDEQLLTTLASQGAVTVQNARLIEKMKREERVRTNLARYLSPEVVEQVIRNEIQVDLGGDRKGVTILFSDIRNFTTIAESQPPDRLVRVLNEYFTEMAGIIFENKGSLDKYIGDAIVAVFGSLIPLENAAMKAADAAVQMIRRLPELNGKWEREHAGFHMEIGIGINTGEVFLGNVGSPERMVYTVIGDTVNVASRFSGMAKPGQILATAQTAERIQSKYLCIKHPAITVRGRVGEVDVYEVTNRDPAR
ncbi:MAG: hypothetical protein JSV00_00590, partial [bacterium]